LRSAAAPWPTTLPTPSHSCSATTALRPPSPLGHTGDIPPAVSSRARAPLRLQAGETGNTWPGMEETYGIDAASAPRTDLLFIHQYLCLFILNVYYV
jgi:hypothetical protein